MAVQKIRITSEDIFLTDGDKHLFHSDQKTLKYKEIQKFSANKELSYVRKQRQNRHTRHYLNVIFVSETQKKKK